MSFLMDAPSEAKLSKVMPELAALVRAGAEDFAAKTGSTFRVTSGLRTYDQQNILYAQGRTAPGEIVTNARGGWSNHNFGCAVDVVPDVHGSATYVPDWNAMHPDWNTMRDCLKAQGLAWGGDWKSITDKPHFQLANVPVTPTQADRDAFARGGLEAVWAQYQTRV